ncbi:SpoIIE family protein phosphatase [Kitasatospora sp. NPDC048298]|uniref:SpoIIE family protein phosphatase n=1 Tax=Kitasatospora sp. NPDC048298 TaxID=3364049 RepID=UPI00371711DA
MSSPDRQPGAPPPSRPQSPLDAAVDATAVVGARGRVIGWTRAAEDLLGYPAARITGQPAARLLADDTDRTRAIGVVERCRTGAGWSGAVPLRHRDGHRMDLDLRVSPAFSLNGQECFLVSGHPVRATWTLSESLLNDFISSSPLGMAVMDPQLRYVWLNETLERIGGIPSEQRLGRRLSEVLPGLQAEKIEALMREVLENAAPVVDYEYQGWSWADPRRRRAYSTSFFPLLETDGAVAGVCYMVMDVTDRFYARERLALVNDASARIGSTLDVTRTAQELADIAVPRFADFVTVDLLESVLHTGQPSRSPQGTRPLMRRVAMRSVHEGCPEAVARVGDPVDFVSPPHDIGMLLRGEPMLIPVLDPDEENRGTLEPAGTAGIREFGLHSLITAPMRARDTVLGLATFLRSRNVAPFEADDLLLARELVARAAVCVDNARRYTREHTAALTLQQSLLPHILAGGTAVEAASSYLPADVKTGVGGDWFDVIPLSGARVALVVGDVVGHGLSAAATMGRLRTAVHTLADIDLPPDELLAHLDDLVLRLDEESTEEETGALGATCLYAVYDPVNRHCTMARAGHPPPVLVSPDGRARYLDLPACPMLGLGGLPFESTELTLAEGSLIGLYTDGLIEGVDRDVDIGMARLAEALSRRGAPLDELCADAVRQLVPGPKPDDVALLLARTRALGDDQVVSWDVPCDPSAVAGVRAAASRRLREWGLDELTMTTELIVSELVTNAIRYAEAPIRLRLLRQSALICEISDASNTSPRLRRARSTDEGGRGLFLVAQLTHRWGTRHTPNGKVIWAEQELPEPPGAASG